MAAKRHDDGRVCLCDRPDGSCAGLVVRRLSHDRVRELAEEIWTVSSGFLPPVRPDGDPRTSQAGASAQTAYHRRRAQERERWRLGWLGVTWAMAGAALAVGLLIGATMGAWLGWPMAVVAGVLAWSRLRFRPSPEAAIWRRQAAMQRRTGTILRALEADGYLVLHDVTLPGWLDSLDHLVVGPTGVWVLVSCQRRRLPRPSGVGAPAGTLNGLRWQTQAIAEVLDGWVSVPVRPLLCVHGRWSGGLRSFQACRLVTPRQLTEVVRSGSPVATSEIKRATGRLLEVLRPAA